MVICVIEIFFMVPLCTFTVIINATDGPFDKYVGFAGLRSDLNRVGQYPAFLWTHHRVTRHTVEINQWILIGSSLLYFAIFGLTEEARKHYRAAFNIICFRSPKPSIIGESREIQRYSYIFRKWDTCTHLVFGNRANPSSLIFIHTHPTHITQKGTSSTTERLACSSFFESCYCDAHEFHVADKAEDLTVNVACESPRILLPAVLDSCPSTVYRVADVAMGQV